MSNAERIREYARRIEEEPQAPPEGVEVLLLTMPQVAALCQVSLDRVRDWSTLPGFPMIRSAHQVRIHAKLFEAWLQRKALEGGEESAA